MEDHRAEDIIGKILGAIIGAGLVAGIGYLILRPSTPGPLFSIGEHAIQISTGREVEIAGRQWDGNAGEWTYIIMWDSTYGVEYESNLAKIEG